MGGQGIAWDLIGFGVLGSLISGLATGLGALLILFRSEWSERSQIVMLSFAAGVMLAASIFSLLLPGYELILERGAGRFAASLETALGLSVGAIAIYLSNLLIPHEHFIKGREGRPTIELGRHWLFILAITLHNIPEGMSVGVAFGGGVERGVPVMLGIGTQNIPEGLAVAAALVGDGFSRWRAFLIALLTGLVEPLGGLVGTLATAPSDVLLPWGFFFAGGAMLYVIFAEVIPETHPSGAERATTLSLMAGFLLMMVLDLSLG